METKPVSILPPTIQSFKGNPVLVLNPGDRFPFSFGLMKARLIVKHFDQIKSFVDANSESKETA